MKTVVWGSHPSALWGRDYLIFVHLLHTKLFHAAQSCEPFNGRALLGESDA